MPTCTLSDSMISDFYKIAMDCALNGGKLARSLMGKTRASMKADKSVVTEADKTVQDMIISRLVREYPSHGFIAEEETDLVKGCAGGEAEFVWTIDPIDGTRNFASNVSLFCTSIALLHHGQPIVGVIYEPNFDWCFSSASNRPNLFNGKETLVSDEPFRPDTVLGISLSTYTRRPASLHHLIDSCIMRNLGSAALHLGMVAGGLIPAAINYSGLLWDIAAGVFLIQQAGGSAVLLDDKGLPTEKPVWPMTLSEYNKTPIPLLAAHPQIIQSISASLTRLDRNP